MNIRLMTLAGLILLWLSGSFGLFLQAAHAHEGMIDIQLDADDSQSLGHFLHLYQDHSGQLTQAQIAGLDAEGGMQHSMVKVLSLGFQAGATWVRFDLHNASSAAQTRWLLLNWPFLQHYNLYLTGADGETRLMRSGSSVSSEQRPLATRYFLFPLELAAGESVRAYLQIAGKASHVIDLQIWSPAAFLDHMTWFMTWKYLALGFTLIIMVFSGLVWQLHRRPGLLALIPGHAFTVLILLGIDGFHVNWMPAREENWAGLLINFSAMLAIFFYTQFLRSFLNLNLSMPRLDRALNLSAWFLLIGVGVFFFLRQIPPTLAATFIMLILLSLVALYAAWKGGTKERGFLAAWGMLLFGFTLRTVQVFGWLPDTDFIGNLPFLGFIASVLLLSSTLMRDIKDTRQSNELNQQLLIRHQQGEQARLRRAVEERTAELRQALANVEQASRAKTTFLSSMSHELRTPLHTVLGFSAQAKQKASDEIRPLLEIIERNGRQLLRLIDDLLCFSRDETATLQLQLEPVRLASFVDHLRQQGNRMAMDSGNRFQLECSPTLPGDLAMDEPRLMQVLLNLISNACKYTEEGLIRLQIDAMPEATGESSDRWKLQFEVSDTGPGIDPADQERIFQPFVRLLDGAARPGMGLGLGIARQWVHAMGGELHLDSVPGQGSRFSFTLVLQQTDAHPQAQPELLDQASLQDDGSAIPVEEATRQGLQVAFLQEMRDMLQDGRLPALQRKAQLLMPEHPQCAQFLLNIQSLCSQVDLPGLEQLLQQNCRAAS
jgi:signal transduction histidine kinase